MDLGGSCSGRLSHCCHLGNGLALTDGVAQSTKGSAAAPGEGSATHCGLATTGSSSPSVMEGAKGVRWMEPKLTLKIFEEKCEVFFKPTAVFSLIRVRAPQQMVNYFIYAHVLDRIKHLL